MAKTQKRRGKPSRGKKQTKSFEEKDMRTTAQKKGTDTPEDNDIRWWSKNPQMLCDAASLPFSQSLGTAVVIQGNAMLNRKDDTAVPGLMTLNYVPAIGVDAEVGNLSSPINLAATSQYSNMRSHNSGGTNYDSPALMFYFLTMDSVYAFYSYMARIYGCLRLYSQKNRYLPRLLVEANGCDYDDLIENMAQFRYFINQYAARASSFCVPSNMSIFERHFWLTQNVFTDDETSKSQMYMFVPSCFFKWYGIYSNAATLSMEYPLRDDTKRTLSDLITIGNDLLNAIMGDQDFNVMSGDMLKTYGEGNLFRLAPIPEDYIVQPVYSEEVLSQIHNATVLGIPSPEFYVGTTSQATWDLNQSDQNCLRAWRTSSTNPSPYIIGQRGIGELFWKTSSGGNFPAIRGGSYVTLATDQILNSHYQVVSPSDVMEMTRLKVAARIKSKANGDAMQITVNACGTEYIANARVYYATYSYATGTGIATPTFNFEPFSTIMSKAEFAVNARFLIFRDHPIVTLLDTKRDSDVGYDALSIAGFIGDLDNYTVVSPDTLARIHEAALLSALDVPMIGTF